MAVITLRKAGLKDSRRLWLWRNDKQVRLNSFSSRIVPYADHKVWFHKKLSDTKCCIWIGQYGGKPCGMVRFEFKTPKSGEIHISVKRALRSRGIGSALLEAGCRASAEQGAQKITAHVLEANPASKSIFEKNGFKTLRKKTVGGKPALLLGLRLTGKKK